MKKFLIIISFITVLITLETNAQNTLSFSRVINIDTTLYTNWNGGAPPNPCTGYFTVPAGKVWKVEAASLTEGGSSNTYFRVNGVNFSLANLNLAPLWLGESSTLMFCISCCGGCGGCNFTTQIVVSIIEFSVQTP